MNRKKYVLKGKSGKVDVKQVRYKPAFSQYVAISSPRIFTVNKILRVHLSFTPVDYQAPNIPTTAQH
jgi:hypothetical protein